MRSNASRLSKGEKFDEAHGIAGTLLLEPALGRLHAAGYHLILACSSDQYVYVVFLLGLSPTPADRRSERAESALNLYQSLYDKSNEPPTADQLERKYDMVAGVERGLCTRRTDVALSLPTRTMLWQPLGGAGVAEV